MNTILIVNKRSKLILQKHKSSLLLFKHNNIILVFYSHLGNARFMAIMWSFWQSQIEFTSCDSLGLFTDILNQTDVLTARLFKSLNNIKFRSRPIH